MARRISGRFWKYDGNSLNGKNHERRTPRGYSLDAVVMVAAIGDAVDDGANPELADLVTSEEARQITVKHHKGGGGFGHEVTVTAPKSVWDKVAS